MHNTITYRHWQPGDDDAVLELLVPAEQIDENIYRNKFESSHIEAEGIRLALLNERVVGHVWGEPPFILHRGQVPEVYNSRSCLC